jgi:acyl-coenzyme A thioesterase PaaI-like protein
MTVQETMCNKDGFLHGGAATTLLDNLSSTALIFIQGEGFWHNFGVTRTFTLVFHKGVAQGERTLCVVQLSPWARRWRRCRPQFLTVADQNVLPACTTSLLFRPRSSSTALLVATVSDTRLCDRNVFGYMRRLMKAQIDTHYSQ